MVLIVLLEMYKPFIYNGFIEFREKSKQTKKCGD